MSAFILFILRPVFEPPPKRAGTMPGQVCTRCEPFLGFRRFTIVSGWNVAHFSLQCRPLPGVRKWPVFDEQLSYSFAPGRIGCLLRVLGKFN